MTLSYGFAKGKISEIVGLKSAGHRSEVQYHIHLRLDLPDGTWDVAINVGTNDADDLVKYKLAYDFHHPLIGTLAAATAGYNDLTNNDALPALDYVRSDVLSETGAWRISDVMDGSAEAEPIPSLMRLFQRAWQNALPIYVFGRKYTGGDLGIHDTHMNQGSSGRHFEHTEGDDGNDHNDIWQDGAVLVDLGQPGWAAYFAAFEQQAVPTDELGNPKSGSSPIDR